MATLPGFTGAGLAARMGKLDAGHRSLARDERKYALERLDMRVTPDAHIFGADPAVGRYRRGFGHHQPGLAYRAATQMDQVPFICQSIAARVLAHGRDRNSIGELYVTKTKRLK